MKLVADLQVLAVDTLGLMEVQVVDLPKILVDLLEGEMELAARYAEMRVVVHWVECSSGYV